MKPTKRATLLAVRKNTSTIITTTTIIITITILIVITSTTSLYRRPINIVIHINFVEVEQEVEQDWSAFATLPRRYRHHHTPSLVRLL